MRQWELSCWGNWHIGKHQNQKHWRRLTWVSQALTKLAMQPIDAWEAAIKHWVTADLEVSCTSKAVGNRKFAVHTVRSRPAAAAHRKQLAVMCAAPRLEESGHREVVSATVAFPLSNLCWGIHPFFWHQTIAFHVSAVLLSI